MTTPTNLVYVRLASLVLACFALSTPKTFGVRPAPDGGYAGANTAEGQNALFDLTTGGYNTAVGWLSLYHDTTGSYNTAIGAGSLLFNNADDNTATGVAALFSNTTGNDNVANGAFALFGNTTGGGNTAVGFNVLRNNNACCNTATGWSALFNNTTGQQNTAAGVNALNNNTEGDNNSGLGWGALLSNQTGNNNTAVGLVAGRDVTGDFNICIGSEVHGVAGENNTIRIGDNLPTGSGQSACYIGGIVGQAANNSSSVFIDTVSGKVAANASSERFKKDIGPMDRTSEAIFWLKPVTFHYKSDETSTPQFGLVAEEVAKVSRALITVDKEGRPYSVRYDQVNAMLLNEFLKEHKRVEQQDRKIQERDATIAELKSTSAKQSAIIAQHQNQMMAVIARLKEQDSQIERISDQIKLVVPVPQVAATD